MKIIDKYTDFYDYLQYTNSDDVFTLIRENSYELTKAKIAENIGFWAQYDPVFLLMQVCNRFWLFNVQVTEKCEKTGWNYNRHYEMDDVELLAAWVDYDTPYMSFFNFYVIEFDWDISYSFTTYDFNGRYYRTRSVDYDKVRNKIDILKQAIHNKNYEVKGSYDYTVPTYNNNHFVMKKMPLIKSSGLIHLIDPVDVYNAMEEYFSNIKMQSERTDALGTTNLDKIKNHGFDTKTSFRKTKI